MSDVQQFDKLNKYPILRNLNKLRLRWNIAARPNIKLPIYGMIGAQVATLIYYAWWRATAFYDVDRISRFCLPLGGPVISLNKSYFTYIAARPIAEERPPIALDYFTNKKTLFECLVAATRRFFIDDEPSELTTVFTDDHNLKNGSAAKIIKENNADTHWPRYLTLRRIEPASLCLGDNLLLCEFDFKSEEQYYSDDATVIENLQQSSIYKKPNNGQKMMFGYADHGAYVATTSNGEYVAIDGKYSYKDEFAAKLIDKFDIGRTAKWTLAFGIAILTFIVS